MLRARFLSLQTCVVPSNRDGRDGYQTEADRLGSERIGSDLTVTDAAAGPAKGAKTKKKQSRIDQPFLLVTLRTRRKTFQVFEERANRLVKHFADAGLELFVSGWRADGPNVRIVNLWRLTDANALIDAELQLVDNPDYLLLDQDLINERKHIVIPVTGTEKLKKAKAALAEAFELNAKEALAQSLAMSTRPTPTAAEHELAERVRRAGAKAAARIVPRGQSSMYAVVTYGVETEDLAEFRARFEAGIKAFRVLTGWKLGNSFLGVTGSDDVITQFWSIPVEHASNVQDFLSRAPWDPVTSKPPSVELLHPSSFDSLMPIATIAGPSRFQIAAAAP